jgi:hypothetical protein
MSIEIHTISPERVILNLTQLEIAKRPTAGVVIQLHDFMQHLKVAIIAAILLGGCVVRLTATDGKPEYTTQEKKACNFCNTVAVSKDADSAKGFTDAGKYYQDHKSLAGHKK